MNRARSPRGFTFIELIAATLLMATLVLLVFGVVHSATQAAGRAGRGGNDAALAAKFCEQFREDVRSATGVQIPAQGKSAILTLDGETLTYACNTEGRMIRYASGGEERIGPRLLKVEFFAEAAKSGAELHLLRARWICAAEMSVRERAAGLASGRVLVLDTALRRNCP